MKVLNYPLPHLWGENYLQFAVECARSCRGQRSRLAYSKLLTSFFISFWVFWVGVLNKYQCNGFRNQYLERHLAIFLIIPPPPPPTPHHYVTTLNDLHHSFFYYRCYFLRSDWPDVEHINDPLLLPLLPPQSLPPLRNHYDDDHHYYFYRYFYFPNPQANGRNIVGQQLSTLWGVVKSFCTYLKFWSAFKFFATNPKKNTQQHAKMVCKRTQHVTPNSAGSCWPTILLPFARDLRSLYWPEGEHMTCYCNCYYHHHNYQYHCFFLVLTSEPIVLMESQKSDNNSSNNNCLAKWKLTILINPF